MNAEYRLIPIEQLQESPTNPRTYFDAKYLGELADSIKAQGVVQPIVVRLYHSPNIYEIVAGACRYRASKLAKAPTVPALVRTLSDEQVIEIQIIENLQRKDVHPLDEAGGYQRLITLGFEVPAIAAKVGKSVSYVYQRIQLDKLIEAAKKAFREDKITAGHAVLIARLQPPQQKDALDFCNNSYRKIGVRDLMAWIDEHVHLDLHGTPWKKDDAQLLPRAGACTSCSKRTGSQPDLFADLSKKDVCTDPACFHAKTEAYFTLVKKEAKANGQAMVEISTHNYDFEDNTKRKGVLYGPAWKEARTGCDSTQVGLVVSGKGKGAVKQVCADKKCEVHWGRAPTHDYNPRTGLSKSQEHKKKAANQARQETITAVVAQVKTLQAEDLRFIAHAILSEMWHERVKEVCKQRGLEPKKTKRSYGGTHIDHEAPIRQLIDDAKPAELPALVMELALSGKISSTDFDAGGKKAYQATLKRYNVDQAKLQARILAELKAKDKAKAKSKAKPKAKPAAKKKALQTSATKKRVK